MSEELFTDDAGPEISEGQPTDDGGEEIVDVEPGPDGEEGQPEPAVEVPKLYAGKFKTVEEMERGYAEAQRLITESTTKTAKYEDSFIEKLAQNLRAQQEPEKPKEPEIAEMTEAEREEFFTNPEQWLAKKTKSQKELFEQWHQEKMQSERVIKSNTNIAQETALNELVADPKYATMSKSAQAAVDTIMDEPEMKAAFESIITEQNFKALSKDDAVRSFKKLFEITYQRARGIAAEDVVRNADVKAMKTAKESYLNKGKGAGSMTPKSSPKPASRPAASESGQDYLKKILNI